MPQGPYTRHVFVCTNERPPGSPRGCCAERGGEEVRGAFKKAIKAAGLQGSVRGNAAGCLDTCEAGCAVVVYPEGVWYQGVQPGDVAEIVERHLVKGEPVERLRMQFPVGPSKEG